MEHTLVHIDLCPTLAYEMKILVAEDEEAIARSYQILLESRSHKVIVCSDGEQCLKAYGRAHRMKRGKGAPAFDLLILDYRMPKKNGLEVAEQILAIVPEQRIIIASAYTHEMPESRGLTQVQFLPKPFEFDAFIGLVEQGPETRSNRTHLATIVQPMIGLYDIHDDAFLYGNISDIFGFR